MSETLHDLLSTRLDALDVPAGDLPAVVRSGLARRRRRRTTVAVGVAAAVVVVGAVAAPLLRGPAAAPRATDFAVAGPLDLSEGLRAWADPGRVLHVGGRELPARKYDYLDTDAAATPAGVVFFQAGRPYLLTESGESTALVDGPVTYAEDFHPTAKADRTSSRVAFATLGDGGATLTVRDLDAQTDVASTEIACGGCGDLVIDALDDGVVFVRDGDGTRTWDSATGEWADFAGPRTRVADVRNGVVLYDGPEPVAAGWDLVVGAIDSQLTFDGGHVLAWSTRLLPTEPDGSALLLDVPVTGRNPLVFVTVDTDGSVLVASGARYPEFTIYDCEVPSGSCTELTRHRFVGGDPMFLGNDM